jgi:DNA helicase II / ATP-dependent DNA helicase PcrA
MEFLGDLNPQQKQAVEAKNGPVLILAGPGSGKTRVLTCRIAYLVGTLNLRPNQILAVTFTNKAAREMEKRVSEMLRERVGGLTLGTFHSVCANILRREARHLPFESNFVIFDSDDQINLTKRVIRDLNIDEKQYSPLTVHASISKAKNELITPEQYLVHNYRDELVKRVYSRYQDLLLASNGLDFDDLLLWTAQLLDANLHVRGKYAQRFEYVLVDEFQDTNLAQYVLLQHLASVHRNIFVVGDIDQSIYRWRGADYRNVLRFEKDYPDAQVILLEQNYRSTQSILDVAMAVIDQNPYRTVKHLFTDRGEGVKVILQEVYDDREEAVHVVNTIATLVTRNEAQPGDFAIMYRTNAQSRLLEEAFLSASLPYKLVGAQRFYGRKEIKDVIAYLRLVFNPNDDISLSRIINTPPRGIGKKTLLDLRTYSQKVSLSPGQLLLDIGLSSDSPHLKPFPQRAATAALNFAAQLTSWLDWSKKYSPLQLMDHIIADVGYEAFIMDGTDEGRDRWENIKELRRLAAEYDQKSLAAFLEDIALVSDQDTLDDSANAPTLLTLHAAKGLEFPIVFIVGLNDGVLPHIRSFEDQEEMQEERRLFYVGITRAKDRLYLVDSLNRNAFGYSEPTIQSRFLDDIPLDLLEERLEGGRSRRIGVRAGFQGNQWQRQDAAKPNYTRLNQSRFHPGSRVNHAIWGEGMVLNSRNQDDDEVVDIFFQDIGLKRVVASLAKLQLIDED